jgi:murein DD-endopeptidase MepM/ murein hydrolase activator NlpD
VPFGFGIVALMTIGSVVAGSPLDSGAMVPAGAVAGTLHQLMKPTIDAHAGDTNPAPIPDAPDAALAVTGDAPSVSGLTGYRWPLPKGRLTLPFGPTPWGSRIVEGETFHDGVDLATFCGDRIVAAHDGVVLAAGRHYDGFLGWLGDLTTYYARLDAKKLWSTLPIMIVIDDGNGYRSMYAHFERVVVKPGQAVLAGSLLGYEGRTGRASGCHVHYGLFSPFARDEFAMDPAVARRMKLPRAEIARVDPLLVLPLRLSPSAFPTVGANRGP